MKIVIRLLILSISLAGLFFLVQLTSDNRQLSDDIQQLEAELGRMRIDDPSRVHIVEIDQPDVPPEVAPNVDRIWQFRCYLPPGYDFIQFKGGGRVAKEGCYYQGGMSSSWASPMSEATHRLLTLSLKRKDSRVEAFYSFGGSTGTSSWEALNPDQVDDGLVIQKLAKSEQGSRSFKPDTILPLIKILDPTTAEDQVVAGQTITTYAGGLFVLCPKSRETEFKQLADGRTPVGFDPSSIAKALSDE